MDWYTRKIVYLWLIFSEICVKLIVLIYSMIYAQKNKNKKLNSIGAYWYYPPDLTGSNLRIGGWRKYFEKEGYVFKDFHINTLQDYVINIENGSWTKKYMFFSFCLWKRLPQIMKAHQFEVLWIDRCMIPYYPRKTAFIERRIKKVVQRMVMDSTDGGDYLGNPALMEQVYQNADRITVGYKYLLDEFEKKYNSVEQVFWTIPNDGYIKKKYFEIKGKPIIGWMGSPGNFNEILKIKEALIAVYEKQPFVFRYICRKNFDSELKEIETDHHAFGDDYYSLIASFDIGISPFITKNMRTMGKIAMKHQEFLLAGLPQVCSEVAISEFVVHKQHALIAKNIEEWELYLSEVINNLDLRIKLGEESKLLFNKNYTYSSQYNKLKKALIEN